MKKIWSTFAGDRTVRANSIMVVGNFIANIGSYFYHLSVGRMLVPADYGALQSLISVTNLFTVPLVTLGTVVAKYVSAYVGRNEPKKINALYHIMRKLCLLALVAGGIILFFFARPILAFLRLSSLADFLLLEFALFFGLLVTLNRSTLQGLSQFVSLTIAQFIEAYGKLILGVFAVFLGFRTTGAFAGFVLITVFSYLYMQFRLRAFIGKREAGIRLPVGSIARYAVPSFIVNISTMSLFNTDVVLVRHFFDAYTSGLYSALSVLGKIIYFGVAPISVAMFPLVSEAHARGESIKRIFRISLFSVVGLSGIVTAVYAFTPVLALKVLIGPQYLGAAPNLGQFAVFLSLASIITFLGYFFLAIQKTFPMYFLVAAAVAQATLLWFFHSSLAMVINVSVGVTSVLTVFLLISYVYATRE